MSPRLWYSVGEYYIHPEINLPKDVTTEEQQLHTPDVRSWEFEGDETMQPFWLVRRLTDSALKA